MSPRFWTFTGRPLWRDWVVGMILIGSGWAVYSPGDPAARVIFIVLGIAGAAVLAAAFIHLLLSVWSPVRRHP